jgi:hypothetical protein
MITEHHKDKVLLKTESSEFVMMVEVSTSLTGSDTPIGTYGGDSKSILTFTRMQKVQEQELQ